MSTLRESSKSAWNSGNTVGDINAGSLQRIADAVERMARSWTELEEERDRYRRWWKEEQSKVRNLERSVSGFRGEITKMKRSQRLIK